MGTSLRLLILEGEQARRQGGGGKASAAVELVLGQKEKEEGNKRKHIDRKSVV